jgi:hypothetical protein
MTEQQFNYKNFFYINRKWIFLALCFVAASYLINVWPIVFLVLFCILNVVLLIYDRYVEVPLDFELSTFSAFIMTLKFGLVWGILAGVITKIAVIISNKDFNRNSIIAIAGYAMAAVFASLFHSLPILVSGILVVLLVNVFTALIMRFVMFVSGYEIAMFSISNIIFNIIIIMGFAEIVFKLIPF